MCTDKNMPKMGYLLLITERLGIPVFSGVVAACRLWKSPRTTSLGLFYLQSTYAFSSPACPKLVMEIRIPKKNELLFFICF